MTNALQEVVSELWILEQRPRPGDLPPEAAAEVIPQADVVAITGTSLINHTLLAIPRLTKNTSQLEEHQW